MAERSNKHISAPADEEHAGLFGYAEVGSYGLGQSLLAWARCRNWCNLHGIEMLAPNWLHVQHRIGPIRRRERDNRQYHRLFRFDGYVTGLHRLFLLTTSKRIPAADTDLDQLLRQRGKGLVLFKNLEDRNEETYFPEIAGQGAEIRRNLLAITKPQYWPAPDLLPHIALHVRMGDFSTPATLDDLRRGAKNSRIPVEWYANILAGLRTRLGPVPARLYSDGSDEALALLLQMPDVVRPPKQPSVTDLLSIGQSRLVISSGSGFSFWGAFLGDAPRICFPGQRFTNVLKSEPGLDLEPECEDVAELPENFIEHARSALWRQ